MKGLNEQRIEKNIRHNKDRYIGVFTDNKFWGKIPQLAHKGGLLAIIHAALFYHILRAPTTPNSVKLSILPYLGFFVAPLDLIPDILPGLGFTDDVFVLSYGVHSLCNTLIQYTTPAILYKVIENTKAVFKNESEENIKQIINSLHYYEQL